MSERRDYFNLLIDALSGHFHQSKQIRVNKVKLLELMFSRMNSNELGVQNLTNSYREKYKPQGNQTQTAAAIRRALDLLSSWFDTYYDSHPDIPIRFKLTENYQLQAVVQDGFDKRSVVSLVRETEQLLTKIQSLSAEASDLLSGKVELGKADRYSKCVDEIAAASDRLKRVSAAAKRRL
jgi:hypothetical protein